MADKVTKLSPKQYKAVEILIKTGSITEAAKGVNRSRKTVYKWLKEDNFSYALDRAAAEGMRLLAQHMTEGARKAAAALLEVIDNPKASRKEIISAARGYLQATPIIKWIGQVESDIQDLRDGSQF